MAKITTKLPVNLKDKDRWIFKRRETYDKPVLKTIHRSNIFLSHYGVALNYLLPVSKTLPNAFGFGLPNSGFIFEFYKKALEEYLVSRFGKSLELKTLSKDKEYLLVFSPWMGYFSWVTESLSRLIKTKERHTELTLILPESYTKKKFVMDSLKMFPELSYEVIPDGVHMIVPHITIPQLKPFTFVFDPEDAKRTRQFVVDYVKKLQLDIETHDFIYISREKAKNRKLVNNDEVVQVFKENGFVELAFENYNFFEQVHLMNHCKVLSGVHGAGFANIHFLPEGSSMFELIKEYSSVREERPSYWRLSSALEIDYYIQYCQPKEYGNYDLWVGVDLIVDINDLRANITQIKHKY